MVNFLNTLRCRKAIWQYLLKGFITLQRSTMMNIRYLGSRGVLVIFDEPYLTNVYIVIGNEHVFVLDTFLGPEPMRHVKKIISERNTEELPTIVFNSHADYDHHWGNCAFEESKILGHRLTAERILREGSATLDKYVDHARGAIVITPPNLFIEDNLIFPIDDIEFFYTPGHTLDSVSALDRKDKVLFVGDNVESPIPYLNHPNFEQYSETLRRYLKLNWDFLVAGHDPLMFNSELIIKDMDYLDSFCDWSIDLRSLSKSAIIRHSQNLSTIEIALREDGFGQDVDRHYSELREILDRIR